jgi:hypothetical protein
VKQEGDHEHEQDQDNDDDDQGIRAAGGCRGAPEIMHRFEETATTGASNVRRHFYVDVQNPEESNYDREEQHIAIDPTFLAQVQTSNDNNINQLLSLPTLIPAKKRKRQQPLLDFT